MLQELMKKNGIESACIIDDANDKTPKAQDLTQFQDQWDDFLDDLTINPTLVELLKTNIHNFDPETFGLNNITDSCIETLWSLKGEFQQTLGPLFEAYESTTLSDSHYVESLSKTLEENNFSVEKVGRDFKSSALKSDIIFIDLFLQLDQTIDNLDTTISIVKEIIAQRLDKPPIIVLISRSNRLEQYRERFRDECGLLESSFRVYSKLDLADKNKLVFCIKKLITHYKDSANVGNFLRSWEEHAKQAVEMTVINMKKLDLLDHNMIHNLLLKDEGQPSSSYFMDLFDTVLLHNFESQKNIVDTAKELNEIDFNSSPTIQGLQKEPLQELVFKSTFMGAERQNLNDIEDIELGDIYRLKEIKQESNSFLENETDSKTVWLVITPTCDLARCGINNIGLLKGALSNISFDNWSTDTKINTPIIKINNESKSIKWDIKSFMTYPKFELQKLLKDKTFIRVARMRELNALSLQQNFTADYSRVGQRAVLPSVFKSTIKLAYLNKNQELVELYSSSTSGSVCYVISISSRVVNFSQTDFDNLLSSIHGLDLADVYTQAKSNVQKIQTNPYLLIEALESGVEVKNSLKDILIDKNVLAKVIFGEPKEAVKKSLKGVGLLFTVDALIE